MDDEICRNELEGNSIGGREIACLSSKESIEYRYDLFLEMYKDDLEEVLMKEKKLEANG